MLKRVHLANFKCFEKVSLTDLRDISILCGPNNAGKSSIVQALVFLKDSQGGRFQWNMVEPQLGDFEDMVHKHDLRRSITISCSFSVSKEDTNYLRWLSKKPSEISYSVRFNRDGVMVQEVVWLDAAIPLFELDYRSDGKKMFLASEFKPTRINKELSGIGFNGTTPLGWNVPANQMMKDPVAALLSNVRDILRRNFLSMHYLSPRRQIPEWYSTLTSLPPHVGYRGENTSPLLHCLHSDRDKTFGKIEKWLKRFDKDIKMLKSPIRATTSAVVTNTKHGDMNIVTSGFGLNTVFPIVVQCLSSAPGSIILIEEPEIHLHPGAQKVLVDLFVETSKTRQIIFTTHSFDMLRDVWERINWEDKDLQNRVIRYNFQRIRGRNTANVAVDRDEWFDDWLDGLKDFLERPG